MKSRHDSMESRRDFSFYKPLSMVFNASWNSCLACPLFWLVLWRHHGIIEERGRRGHGVSLQGRGEKADDGARVPRRGWRKVVKNGVSL